MTESSLVAPAADSILAITNVSLQPHFSVPNISHRDRLSALIVSQPLSLINSTYTLTEATLSQTRLQPTGGMGGQESLLCVELSIPTPEAGGVGGVDSTHGATLPSSRASADTERPRSRLPARQALQND
ncbi:hypothetical protein E2C01_006593 [Portunus trituberculatus]|uniref:Uncharacterized protein n=1 Tax=Portunus trituberculatus TaxID=210409 RepID=A0A5B7CXR1_PORTR|nr:hypothetical protein [Portunus trituberculatus]